MYPFKKKEKLGGCCLLKKGGKLMEEKEKTPTDVGAKTKTHNELAREFTINELFIIDHFYDKRNDMLLLEGNAINSMGERYRVYASINNPTKVIEAVTVKLKDGVNIRHSPSDLADKDFNNSLLCFFVSS